jgi:hypothetical protein
LICSLDENKPVRGLATLNNELYVRHEKWRFIGDGWDVDEDNDDFITIYETKTYRVQRNLRVPGLGGVHDMTACRKHLCIYIADGLKKVIHRVQQEKKTTRWLVGDVPEGLSVTSAFNLLVTCSMAGTVNEYTTDGQLIRKLSLQPGLEHPVHTVELRRDLFVVCHGQADDSRHRVCLVDSNGSLLNWHGNEKGSGSGHLNGPVRLAANRFILVADMDNNRILMLNPQLIFIREIVSELRGPCRLWYDQETELLYVADNQWFKDTYISGNVRVYSIDEDYVCLT